MDTVGQWAPLVTPLAAMLIVMLVAWRMNSVFYALALCAFSLFSGVQYVPLALAVFAITLKKFGVRKSRMALSALMLAQSLFLFGHTASLGLSEGVRLATDAAVVMFAFYLGAVVLILMKTSATARGQYGKATGRQDNREQLREVGQ